jgi:hypothetical protein
VSRVGRVPRIGPSRAAPDKGEVPTKGETVNTVGIEAVLSDTIGADGQVRITRSARKRRIGNAHILAAMMDAGVPTVDGDALVYIGRDDRGVELHIIAVPDDRGEGLAVIRAMPHERRKS